MFFATFEDFNMHTFYNVVRKLSFLTFYNVFQRVHQGEMRQKLNEIWQNMGSPLEKNPQIRAVILFQQIQLSCIFDVPDDIASIKKKIGINNYPSGFNALKLVLLRHNL